MKSLLRLLSITFMLMSANQVFATQCAQTGVWDWYADEFKDFDGRYMDKPWFSDAHIGVSMETNPMCYEDGWRMMSRRFKCTDFYSDTQCAGAVSRPGSYKPRFALYNIHTGVVRFFLYVDSGVAQTQRVQLSFSMDQGSSSHDYGLFLNDNDEVTIYGEKSTATNTGKVMMFPSYGLSEQAPKWLVFDKYLSYEPNKTPDDGLQFNIYIDGIEESAINLAGDFDFKIEEVQASSEKSVVETLVDSADDVMKAYSSVSEFSSDLQDKGNAMINKELEDSGYDPNDGPPNLTSRRYSLGIDMVNLAVTIGTVSGPIGYVAAGATLVDALDNSPSSPKISYGTGSINLDGSTFSQYAINHRAFGVPYSNHNEPVNEAQLEDDGYTDSLGLFHFSGKPEMAFYEKEVAPGEAVVEHALVGRLLDDVRPLVTINPNSGMVLDEIKIMPYFELKDYGLAGDFPIVMTHGAYGMKEEEAALYTSGLQVRALEKNHLEMKSKYFDETAINAIPNYDASGQLETIGLIQIKSPEKYHTMIGSEFFDVKDAMYFSIRASGDSRFMSNPWVYFIEDAKLKVYLKFKHIEKPNVFAEFVKILDVDEYSCDSKSADTLLSSHGTKSMDVCQGKVDTDNDGVQDYLEVGFSLNPFDGLDGGLDFDGDEQTNAQEIFSGTNPYEFNVSGSCDLTGLKYDNLFLKSTVGYRFQLTLSTKMPDIIHDGETVKAYTIVLGAGFDEDTRDDSQNNGYIDCIEGDTHYRKSFYHAVTWDNWTAYEERASAPACIYSDNSNMSRLASLSSSQCQ